MTLHVRYNTAMPPKVIAVRVERIGYGRTKIDATTYRKLVDDAVRPIREGKSDLPDIPYAELARKMRNAVRNHVLGFLQTEGELFPTE